MLNSKNYINTNSNNKLGCSNNKKLLNFVGVEDKDYSFNELQELRVCNRPENLIRNIQSLIKEGYFSLIHDKIRINFDSFVSNPVQVEFLKLQEEYILGVDGYIYGNYKKGEVVTLPLGTAYVFLVNGYCRIII